MDREGFLRFVAEHHWRTAKSSPHQYTIKHWSPDRSWFLSAVRFAYEHGDWGSWNGEWFSYYRPGDGWRYWTYFDGNPEKLGEGVCFNRARESGQMRLWSD